MNLYHFYSKGYLPNEGGILNQTNVFVQAARVLDDEIGKLERERYEAEERKRKTELNKTKARRGGRRYAR